MIPAVLRPRETEPALEVEAGRWVWRQVHTFARPERVWVPANLTLRDIRDELLPAADGRARVRVDGRRVEDENLDICPKASVLIEVFQPASGGGVLRSIIRAAAIFAVAFVTFILTGNLQLAWQVGVTVGGFLGNLIANALVPPSQSGDGRIDGPRTYSIEGLRNSARIGQPAPIVLGTHRVYADVIVPFYQEVIGTEVYLTGAVCWAAHDVSLTDLKNGDTPLTGFEGVTVQHSLVSTDPAPTLAARLPSPQGVGAELENTQWSSRVSGPAAIEANIILQFPEGIGWLKNGSKKKNRTVTIEVRHRLSGSSAGYSTITRTYIRAAPGEPFFSSIRVSLPGDGAREIGVRKVVDTNNVDENFDQVIWTTLTSLQKGNPFPDPRLAVTAIRYKASNEMSGVLDSLNALVSSRAPKYSMPSSGPDTATPSNWSGSAASSNPADLTLFAARGAHQAAPTTDALIDWPAMARWAQFCTENGFTFNHVETSPRRKGDLLQLIASAGRARLIYVQGRLTPIIDAPQPDGPRTILTPDNATNFMFRKHFPAEVHALRLRFTNRANNYRDDERYHYMPGYNSANSELIEDFSILGVDDADLIARHGEYWARTQQLQTLSGSAVQDIEGGMILRYGDRIGVRHSTVQVSGESGWVEAVTKNQAGQITAFTLSEACELNTSETFVARWRKIGTDSSGAGYVSANHLAPLSVSTSGVTKHFTFATPVAADIGPEDGAILVIGILGSEIIDALVRGITPMDDRGETFQIDWVLYAPQRFEDVTAPPHTPILPPIPAVEPASPELVGSGANNEGIFVAFDVPYRPSAVLTGFDVWYAEMPDAGSDYVWHERPALSASARTLRLPPGRPGEKFAVKMVARARGGLVSQPTVFESLAAYEYVPPPMGVSAAAATRNGVDGSKIPVIAVVASVPDDTALIETLVIEVREASTAQWRVATTAPGSNPVKDVTAITPSRTYDVRFSYRTIRGSETALVDRPVITGVTVPGLTAGDAAGLGGTSASNILNDLSNSASQTALDDAIAAVNEARANADLQLQRALTDQGTLIKTLQEQDEAHTLSLAAQQSSLAGLNASVATISETMVDEDALSAQSLRISNVEASLKAAGVLDPLMTSTADVWSANGGEGTLYHSRVVTDAAGGHVMAAVGYVSAIANEAIPIDTSKKYRIRLKARQKIINGYPIVYAGLNCLDANKQHIAGYGGSYLYAAAANTHLTTSWQTFENIITGEGGENFVTFRPGTKFVQRVVLLNYPNGAGDAEVDLFDFEEVTDFENSMAAITKIEDVLISSNGDVTALIQDTVTVDGQVAAVSRINVIKENGTVISDGLLAVGSYVIATTVNGQFAKTVEFKNGDVLNYGNLNVGAGIFIGGLKLAVQVRPFYLVNVNDGISVNYGTDLGEPPTIEPDWSSLPALPAGSKYVMTLTNPTGSGCTINLKAHTSGTSSTINEGQSGLDGGAGNPTKVCNKTNVNDASDGKYTFTVWGAVYVQDAIPSQNEPGWGQCTVALFVKSNGSWQQVGTVTLSAAPTQNGWVSATATKTVNFAGPIGSTIGYEFGASIFNAGTGGIVSALKAAYNISSGATITSATPNGETISIKVIPYTG